LALGLLALRFYFSYGQVLGGKAKGVPVQVEGMKSREQGEVVGLVPLVGGFVAAVGWCGFLIFLWVVLGPLWGRWCVVYE
jgi:hypothetical protein